MFLACAVVWHTRVLSLQKKAKTIKQQKGGEDVEYM